MLDFLDQVDYRKLPCLPVRKGSLLRVLQLGNVTGTGLVIGLQPPRLVEWGYEKLRGKEAPCPAPPDTELIFQPRTRGYVYCATLDDEDDGDDPYNDNDGEGSETEGDSDGDPPTPSESSESEESNEKTSQMDPEDARLNRIDNELFRKSGIGFRHIRKLPKEPYSLPGIMSTECDQLFLLDHQGRLVEDRPEITQGKGVDSLPVGKEWLDRLLLFGWGEYGSDRTQWPRVLLSNDGTVYYQNLSDEIPWTPLVGNSEYVCEMACNGGETLQVLYRDGFVDQYTYTQGKLPACEQIKFPERIRTIGNDCGGCMLGCSGKLWTTSDPTEYIQTRRPNIAYEFFGKDRIAYLTPYDELCFEQYVNQRWVA